jgi:hypothetical protein
MQHVMVVCKSWGFHGGDYEECVLLLLVTANVVPSSEILRHDGDAFLWNVNSYMIHKALHQRRRNSSWYGSVLRGWATNLTERNPLPSFERMRWINIVFLLNRISNAPNCFYTYKAAVDISNLAEKDSVNLKEDK